MYLVGKMRPTTLGTEIELLLKGRSFKTIGGAIKAYRQVSTGPINEVVFLQTKVVELLVAEEVTYLVGKMRPTGILGTGMPAFELLLSGQSFETIGEALKASRLSISPTEEVVFLQTKAVKAETTFHGKQV